MSKQEQEQEPTPEQPAGWSSRANLFAALFLYAAAVILFFYLAYEESQGRGFSGHAAVVLLYKLGGKWLVSGVAAAGATGFLIVGVRGARKSRD